MKKTAFCSALGLVLILLSRCPLRAQTAFSVGLPDTPQPQPPEPSQQTTNQSTEIRPPRHRPSAGFPPISLPTPGRPPVPISARSAIGSIQPDCMQRASSLAQGRMCCNPNLHPFARFVDYGTAPSLTPEQKFGLAWRNVRDPYNLLTIGGQAAISTASDSHSQYGPGMPGFAKYAGVSLTQDMVGEFFSTFLIPSLAHQDPRYHRMPNLPVQRRILHVLDAVVISQGDDGNPMFNYATVFGTIGTSALGNLYVPGRKKSWGASVSRISVSLATAPIGYVVTEFLPDVARRININVVLVQTVINRVEVAEGVPSTD